jgi:ubiquinol-cytochrome c reductase cytochrome b subunit
MNDATKSYKGLKLSTNSFTFQDCDLLVQVLYNNFNLKSSVQALPPFSSPSLPPSLPLGREGREQFGEGGKGPYSKRSAGIPPLRHQYVIYIFKESMPLLRTIVLPYIIPEMKYKIIE